ncbi:hypothetical protein MNBD_DELTA03-1513 [hydrothermal vent metagenome]|uniref:Uncharacterized protein n=1 Tax=hydrothermal vent metagenome TaxID=652676 RepID=A0A3B0V3V6_9ZZZZ
MSVELIERESIIEDEVLIVETSGEMPEVAYHGSLYYLSHDPEGPELGLARADKSRLRLAVLEGYRRIIRRDLDLENRQKSCYRGLIRCLVNWRRLTGFAAAHRLSLTELQEEIAAALQTFLAGEAADIRRGCPTCVNCSQAELRELINEVGLSDNNLPPDLKRS